MTLTPFSTDNPEQNPNRVLIVDDETELTSALCEMLKKHGYDARGFSSPQEALAHLAESTYDILMADLMMPEMDGITLLRSAIEIDPDLVGIIMTGQGTVQTAVEAMKTGAFDYILKPFKMNSVLAILTRAAEVRRLRLENIQMREILNVYELGQVVAFTLDMNVIFKKTSEAALEQLQADEVSILLKDDENEDELVLAAEFGDTRDLPIGQRVPLDGTVSGWVARHREPVTLEGEVNDPRFSSAYPRPEIRAAVSMPMVLGNRLVGVMNVNKTRKRRPLTSGQLLALRLLVGIAASALENARLYEQTKTRLAHLTTLRTIDQAISSSLDLKVTLNILLESALSQLGGDSASIMLLNPQSQVLEYAAGIGFRTTFHERSHTLLGYGFSGTAALDRRTVMVTNLAAEMLDANYETWIAEESFQSAFYTPLVAKGEVPGVMEVFYRGSFYPSTEWMEFFEALAGQAAIAVDNWRMFDNLQRSNQQLMLAYNATIEGWSAALDLRDQETEGHTRRVTEMAIQLAQTVGGLDEDDLLHIRQGALLHDIGKMGVPDSILLKQGELNEEEWKIMRRHPEYAYQLLSPITYLRKALAIPYSHHERWDGSGYPQGLKGDQIPLPARIFAVVDVYDALRSDRPYRKGWPEEKVRRYLRERAGIDFDPPIVQTFLTTLENHELSAGRAN